MLVFQNALAFNADVTPVAQASSKLVIVFERLFYEYVLNVEFDPLNKPESCLVCHVSDDHDNRIFLCDRCDGYYHLDCLVPPIQLPARAEWFCPSCIEERDVSMIHPLRFIIFVIVLIFIFLCM